MSIWGRICCNFPATSPQEVFLANNDFPALFKAADKCSDKQQKIFYWGLGAQLLLLVATGLISTINYPAQWLAVIQTAFLSAALIIGVILHYSKADKHWYSARAVAESVKTLTWRYVARADPFHTDDKTARDHFTAVLGKVLEQNKDVAKRFSTNLGEVQITTGMESLRGSDFETRKHAYVEGRVVDQHNWYARKNRINSCLSSRWFWLLALIIFFAAICSYCNVLSPGTVAWPVDFLVSSATAVLAWTQAKRFSELSASYSLAANEISIIRAQAANVVEDDALSTFVSNAENAFSREHTQWVARRD